MGFCQHHQGRQEGERGQQGEQEAAAADQAQLLHAAEICQHHRKESERRGERTGSDAGGRQFEHGGQRRDHILALLAFFFIAGNEVDAEVVGQPDQDWRDEDRNDRQVSNHEGDEPHGPAQTDRQGGNNQHGVMNLFEEQQIEQRHADERDQGGEVAVGLRA